MRSWTDKRPLEGSRAGTYTIVTIGALFVLTITGAAFGWWG